VVPVRVHHPRRRRLVRLRLLLPVPRRAGPMQLYSILPARMPWYLADSAAALRYGFFLSRHSRGCALMLRTGRHHAPSPAAVSDPTRGRMVVVCGITSASTDEVWAFSFTAHTWSRLPRGPSPRFDMGAATDGTNAWFYGGFVNGLQVTDELWQFDLTSDTWTLLPQSKVRPSPRTNMGIGFNSGSLYIVGGHDATGVTLGTSRYQFSSQTWTQLSPTGTLGAGAHFASATDSFCNVLFLAGGDHDDNIDVNATDVFSFPQPSFLRLQTTTDFSPSRRHSALVLEPQSHKLMLFGGLHDPSQMLSDTWIYRLGMCPQ
jgi:hypothetical protein